MEELNEICEVLMEKCACSWVRDQTNEAQDKYSALMSQVQGKLSLSFQRALLKFCVVDSNILFDRRSSGVLSTMNKNITDQNEYETYKTEVSKWLENANKIIDKCNNIQNLDDINSNLNDINVSFNLP